MESCFSRKNGGRKNENVALGRMMWSGADASRRDLSIARSFTFQSPLNRAAHTLISAKVVLAPSERPSGSLKVPQLDHC